MFLSVTVDMTRFPLFHGAEGQAAHQLALAHPAENENRGDRHGGGGGELGPEQALGGGERGDERGQGGRGRGREVQAPERLVPAQDDRQQGGRGDARQRQRQQQIPDLLLRLGAIHAAG